MSPIMDETKYFIIKDWHQLIGTHREMCTKHRGLLFFFFGQIMHTFLPVFESQQGVTKDRESNIQVRDLDFSLVKK